MSRIWRVLVVALCLFLAAAASATAQPTATYVGATAVPWSTGNQTIGPLQDDKLFYGPTSPLPAQWPSNNYGLPPGTLAIIAYKVPTTNVVSFVKSIPAGQPVAMVYWQEPEEHMTASQFVSAFEQQSNLIRSAGNTSVKVADDSSTYAYNAGQPGYGCSYIVPNTYVDWYLGDMYEPQDAGLPNSADFQRWVACTHGLNRPRGLAEYGLGDCQGNTTRANTITSDAAYLRANFPNLKVFSYWWDNNSPNSGTSCSNDWQFTDSQTISAWRALEP